MGTEQGAGSVNREPWDGERAEGRLLWRIDQAGTACEVRLHESTAGPLLECIGELCFTTAEPLGAVLFEMINRRGPSLRLHLGGIRFIDARGVSLMIRLHHTATDLGGELTVLEPSPQVRRLLAVVGADELLPRATDWRERPALH